MIEELAFILMPFLDKPFAFFGHSMGALIGYELAHYLHRNFYIGPAHLFVAAGRAPHLVNLEPPYYAHNTLLGTLRDGGLIGGLLYVCILLYAGHIGLRTYRETGDPFYLACLLFGVLCMLTDTDEVITRPRELWIIFWLPLAILIARSIKRSSAQAHLFAPPPSGTSDHDRV